MKKYFILVLLASCASLVYAQNESSENPNTNRSVLGGYNANPGNPNTPLNNPYEQGDQGMSSNPNDTYSQGMSSNPSYGSGSSSNYGSSSNMGTSSSGSSSGY
jgi:hypothetical protein